MYGRSRFFDFFLWAVGCIRVDRNLSTDAGYLGELHRACRKGELICVFPEAHFNRGTDLLPFQQGGAYIAAHFHLPVLTVYTDSVYGLFKRARVTFGGLTPPPEEEAIVLATDGYRAGMQVLKNQLEKARREEDYKHREGLLNRLAYRFTQLGIGAYLSVVYRPKILYRDRRLQSRRLRGPVIVVCNHVHMFDPPMLCTVFYRARLHILAAGEIFETSPFVALTLRICNAIRLNRNGGIDTRSYRECVETLKRGQPLGIFPEGHISPDGQLQPFMPGFLMIAQQTGATILPVCFSHRYRAFGKRLKVMIGTPLQPEKPAGESLSVWTARTANLLREEMEAMHRELTER